MCFLSQVALTDPVDERDKTAKRYRDGALDQRATNSDEDKRDDRAIDDCRLRGLRTVRRFNDSLIKQPVFRCFHLGNQRANLIHGIFAFVRKARL